MVQTPEKNDDFTDGLPSVPVPQPCIKCCRESAYTWATWRKPHSAGDAVEERTGMVCDDCIRFVNYCGRSHDEHMVVVSPSPRILRKILKNHVSVTVLTESDRTHVLDAAERAWFIKFLAKDNLDELTAATINLNQEITGRNDSVWHVPTVTGERGAAPDSRGLSEDGARARALLEAVDDAGLKDLANLILGEGFARSRRKLQLAGAGRLLAGIDDNGLNELAGMVATESRARER